MEGKENVFTVIINDAIAEHTTDVAFGTTTTSKDFERLQPQLTIYSLSPCMQLKRVATQLRNQHYYRFYTDAWSIRQLATYSHVASQLANQMRSKPYSYRSLYTYDRTYVAKLYICPVKLMVKYLVTNKLYIQLQAIVSYIAISSYCIHIALCQLPLHNNISNYNILLIQLYINLLQYKRYMYE